MTRRAASLVGVALLLACTDRGLEGFEIDATTDAHATETETETTTDGVDTSETSAAELDDGTMFVPPVDLPADACDPWTQDCPPGQKCVPYSSDRGGTWNANKCVDVLGDAGPGEPCEWSGIEEALDSCDATSMCWDVMVVDGASVGVCRAFCQGNPEDPWCAPGHRCLIPSEGAINLCIPTCDPLIQDCGEGLGCYWYGDDFSCIFTTGQLETGEPCGFLNDCTPGNFCATGEVVPGCEGSACCAAFCDLEAPACAHPGTSCVPFFEEGAEPPNYAHVGVCIDPG